MGRKFKLTWEMCKEHGMILHRIVALKDFHNPQFGTIKKGTKGGWVTDAACLSQEGGCWIAAAAIVSGAVREDATVMGNAKVLRNAVVRGNAIVSDDAEVFGHAEVSAFATVSGQAKVGGEAKISGEAWVAGGAYVSGNVVINEHTTVTELALVHGDVLVTGFADIRGDADLMSGEYCGNARITSRKQTMVVHGVLPFPVTFFPDRDDNTIVNESLFTGTVEEWYGHLERMGIPEVLPAVKAVAAAYEESRKQYDKTSNGD